MQKQECFRRAAAVVLLRDTASGIEILLVHKPRKKDAWQLPQGGVEEGETITECALRELREETGVEDVRVLGVSDRVYEYRFPATYRRFRPDHICGQRIAFLCAVSPVDVHVRVDGKEIDGFEWITPAAIGRRIKRVVYRDLVHALIGEASRLHSSAPAGKLVG